MIPPVEIKSIHEVLSRKMAEVTDFFKSSEEKKKREALRRNDLPAVCYILQRQLVAVYGSFVKERGYVEMMEQSLGEQGAELAQVKQELAEANKEVEALRAADSKNYALFYERGLEIEALKEQLAAEKEEKEALALKVEDAESLRDLAEAEAEVAIAAQRAAGKALLEADEVAEEQKFQLAQEKDFSRHLMKVLQRTEDRLAAAGHTYYSYSQAPVHLVPEMTVMIEKTEE